jgi:hypothetical protein
MKQINKIEQIRSVLRAIEEVLSEMGSPQKTYTLQLKVNFPPAGNLTPEQVSEAVTKNKEFYAGLTYALQALINHESSSGLSFEQARTSLRKFEQELSMLPQEWNVGWVAQIAEESDFESNFSRKVQERLDASSRLVAAAAEPLAQRQDPPSA